MEPKSPLTKELLDRIYSDKKEKRPSNKRKVPGFLLFINLLLVLTIIYLFKSEHSDSPYFTTSLSYRNASFRYTVSRRKKSDQYIFSLTINSNSLKDITLPFKGLSILTVKIKYMDQTITTFEVGEKPGILLLKTQEAKSFMKSLDREVIRTFALENPQCIIPQQKSLIPLDVRHIPLQAVITLNSGEPVSTYLNFKYEVDL